MKMKNSVQEGRTEKIAEKKECERKSKTKVKVKGKLEINEESPRNSIHN